MDPSYKALKPLPKREVLVPKERVPKGMVRARAYELHQFQQSFKRTK